MIQTPFLSVSFFFYYYLLFLIFRSISHLLYRFSLLCKKRPLTDFVSGLRTPFRAFCLLLYRGSFFFLDYVVCAAFHDACCGNKGQLRLFLKLGNGKRAAVAHGGLDLA